MISHLTTQIVMSNYVLCLDVGERRIGIALASTIARLPAPLTTIDRNQETDVYETISQITKSEDVSVVVVGLPRGMQGQETKQTIISRQFAQKLSEAISVPIVMQDEAGTSLEAERILKERGKAYEKGDIDAEAATIILRDYLNQITEHSS